ncbi:MAG TPA: hypothetical protein VK280_12615, partial [Streptosporangiaceae bacterium]|nr:hypothetical protein [Streptosporangiaceae bacterium]
MRGFVFDAGAFVALERRAPLNFSVASLGYNRELGILTSDPRIVAAIAATLAHDYAGAASYSPGSGARCTAT